MIQYRLQGPEDTHPGFACRVLTWAQQLMGREYLVGDQLVGKDVPSTAAPQVGVMKALCKHRVQVRCRLLIEIGGSLYRHECEEQQSAIVTMSHV